MKSKIKKELSRCPGCRKRGLVVTKNRRKDGRIEYRAYCPLCKSDQATVIEPDCCEECGESLPEPVQEERGTGRLEPVTYCPCGAVYTGGT